jgi:hypothetical protein
MPDLGKLRLLFLSMKDRRAARESPLSLLFLGPGGQNLLDLVWPLDLSTAAVAELVAEEDFTFAIFAEKPFLLLKFLGYGDLLRPRFSANREGSDMLLYAAVSSKLG